MRNEGHRSSLTFEPRSLNMISVSTMSPNCYAKRHLVCVASVCARATIAYLEHGLEIIVTKSKWNIRNVQAFVRRRIRAVRGRRAVGRDGARRLRRRRMRWSLAERERETECDSC